jgi:ubiquinone/menaquinone biosynthesis C-methylase UbiE
MTEVDVFDPQATYNAASRDYDAASALFWGVCADRTVELIGLREGEEVLDVACGPGRAALRAAGKVGPSGRVVGLDIAEQMLSIAREHARARSVRNVTFELGDMTKLPYPAESFDAVVCVFGIFFVDDIVGVAHSFWQLVRPGGRLAITTLGRNFFAPHFDVFLDAAKAERPDLDVPLPWRRTQDPQIFRAMLLDAAVTNPRVVRQDHIMDLADPGDWWQIVLGTGIRRIVVELGEAASARIRAANEAWLRQHAIKTIELGVNYATATKPA